MASARHPYKNHPSPITPNTSSTSLTSAASSNPPTTLSRTPSPRPPGPPPPPLTPPGASSVTTVPPPHHPHLYPHSPYPQYPHHQLVAFLAPLPIYHSHPPLVSTNTTTVKTVTTKTVTTRKHSKFPRKKTVTTTKIRSNINTNIGCTPPPPEPPHIPPTMNRQEEAFAVRKRAARLALNRPPVTQTPYQDPTSTKAASYTKGLPHVINTGLLENPRDFDLFVRAIETGDLKDIRALPLGPRQSADRFISGISRGDDNTPLADVRAWESMAAGNAFDLQGPDPQSLAMPTPPAIDSAELVAEMNEIYWMALLRDIPFSEFETNPIVQNAIQSLNQTEWIKYASHASPPTHLSDAERARLRGPFDPCSVFRGILKGDNVGPYLSQFLVAGTKGIGGIGSPEDGKISYGAHRIDQRVRLAEPYLDYMTTWASWLDVQNGADLRGRERYAEGYRFMATPRDLATYVHYDALYQAYFNACVMLLALKAPFDSGLPFLEDDDIDKQQAFALFGGPHILTLVTEVATRALKAVRYQKFSTHRRLRPEAVAGLLERVRHEPGSDLYKPAAPLYDALDKDLLERVSKHNGQQNEISDFGNARVEDYDPRGRTGENVLLPMAFPEGSPMHPSYGAGHATVAGACTTILKAWFDSSWKMPEVYQATADGQHLMTVDGVELTLEGELNKVCSNVSIGRNWAGVHYFTDYIESIKLGEDIAIGILEEQMLTYHEKVSMTISKFDGTKQTISNS